MKTKHLGKNNTKTPVGYKILDPIIRDRLSESHGIDTVSYTHLTLPTKRIV